LSILKRSYCQVLCSLSDPERSSCQFDVKTGHGTSALAALLLAVCLLGNLKNIDLKNILLAHVLTCQR
jgi:hypothetical protein